MEVFRECVESDQYLPEIKKDDEVGEKLGIDGTPAIFVNGIRIPGGANPYSAIQPVIEQELNQ